MSYRAFKRLLGETSLERKCRFLFGGMTVLLIAGSFWFYARQTEHLAYDQILTACRLLVIQIVDKQIATGCRPASQNLPPPAPAQTKKRTPSPGKPTKENPGGKAHTSKKIPGKGQPAVAPQLQEGPRRTAQVIDEFRRKWEERWSKQALKGYSFRIIRADDKPHQNLPNQATLERLKEFQANPDKHEDNHLALSQRTHFYYGAVRASKTCLGCHRRFQPDLQEGDLLAVITIKVPTESIAEGFHYNRAILITTALGTALLIMLGSYFIVRYVIVKPVKHLKEVSDAISAGEWNVRSEIQTGDEFENLSHAFNRMLRTWSAMQERLRNIANDLDRKVDQLAQANLALYESNRLKSDFLATMSHELRTPLNSILGFSEVLLASANLSDKQRRWATNIQTSGQQLLNLINDILDLARIESGKMEVHVVEFDVRDVCEGLLTMFRPMAEKKNIELRGIYPDEMDCLRQDRVKLQQILSNLLSNAVKFTPEGGRVLLKVHTSPANLDRPHTTPVIPAPAPGGSPSVPGPAWERATGSVDPESRTDEREGLYRENALSAQETFGVLPLGISGSENPVPPADLILTVIDTGVGIAQEEQERIFEKFRQGGHALTREHTGTGLGLSIVRELSKLLGGDVTLESELGRGSTFTVRLPMQLSQEHRLEFDLADKGIDLSKAQRVDAQLQTRGTVEEPNSSR